MNRKNIYLIVFASVAIFLLLIGVLYFFNSLAKKTANVLSDNQANNQVAVNQPAVSAGAVSPGTSTSISPLDLAKKNNNVNECLKIKDNPDYANNCVFLLADYANNAAFCAKIGDPDKAQYCADKLIYNQAVAAKKISLCLTIKTAGLNESCVENVINGLPGLKKSDCDTLPDRERPYCLNYLDFMDAMAEFNQAKSAADCQKITQFSVQAECLLKYPK